MDSELVHSYIKSKLFELKSNIRDKETLEAICLFLKSNNHVIDDELILKILNSIDKDFRINALDMLWRQCLTGRCSLKVQHVLASEYPEFLLCQLDTMINEFDMNDPNFIKFTDSFTDLVILCKKDKYGSTFQAIVRLFKNYYIQHRHNLQKQSAVKQINRILMKELQNQSTEYYKFFPIHLRALLTHHPIEHIRGFGLNLIEKQQSNLNNDDKTFLKIGFPHLQ